VVILGRRGLTGISTAVHLRAPFVLFERKALGGHARTDERDGYRFDKTGHWLHLPIQVKQPSGSCSGPDGADRAQGQIFRGALTATLSEPLRVAARGDQECLLGHRREVGQATAAEPASSRTTAPLGADPKHSRSPTMRRSGVHPREITAAWCSRRACPTSSR
jgi:hypothetical protein